jgi:hypothetical protein
MTEQQPPQQPPQQQQQQQHDHTPQPQPAAAAAAAEAATPAADDGSRIAQLRAVADELAERLSQLASASFAAARGPAAAAAATVPLDEALERVDRFWCAATSPRVWADALRGAGLDGGGGKSVAALLSAEGGGDDAAERRARLVNATAEAAASVLKGAMMMGA